MTFSCTRCQTRYHIADEKVRGKILQIRCKACQHIIEVRDPEIAAPSTAPGALSSMTMLGISAVAKDGSQPIPTLPPAGAPKLPPAHPPSSAPSRPPVSYASRPPTLPPGASQAVRAVGAPSSPAAPAVTRPGTIPPGAVTVGASTKPSPSQVLRAAQQPSTIVPPAPRPGTLPPPPGPRPAGNSASQPIRTLPPLPGSSPALRAALPGTAGNSVSQSIRTVQPLRPGTIPPGAATVGASTGASPSQVMRAAQPGAVPPPSRPAGAAANTISQVVRTATAKDGKDSKEATPMFGSPSTYQRPSQIGMKVAAPPTGASASQVMRALQPGSQAPAGPATGGPAARVGTSSPSLSTGVPALRTEAPPSSPASPPEPKIWYVQRGPNRLGPHSWTELEGMARERAVSPEDLVWSPNLTEWKPAREVEALAKILPAPTPPPAPLPPPPIGARNGSSQPEILAAPAPLPAPVPEAAPPATLSLPNPSSLAAPKGNSAPALPLPAAASGSSLPAAAPPAPKSPPILQAVSVPSPASLVAASAPAAPSAGDLFALPVSTAPAPARDIFADVPDSPELQAAPPVREMSALIPLSAGVQAPIQKRLGRPLLFGGLALVVLAVVGVLVIALSGSGKKKVDLGTAGGPGDGDIGAADSALLDGADVSSLGGRKNPSENPAAPSPGKTPGGRKPSNGGSAVSSLAGGTPSNATNSNPGDDAAALAAQKKATDLFSKTGKTDVAPVSSGDPKGGDTSKDESSGSEKIAMEIVADAQSGAKSCATRSATEGEFKKSTRVTINLKVDDSGKVTAVNIGNVPPGTYFEKCVSALYRRVNFSKAGGSLNLNFSQIVEPSY